MSWVNWVLIAAAVLATSCLRSGSVVVIGEAYSAKTGPI
jgi:hypothetical protein